MDHLTLRKCHCGGDVRVVEAGKTEVEISKSRIIFCDACTGIWSLALCCPKDELIKAWNTNPTESMEV